MMSRQGPRFLRNLKTSKKNYDDTHSDPNEIGVFKEVQQHLNSGKNIVLELSYFEGEKPNPYPERIDAEHFATLTEYVLQNLTHWLRSVPLTFAPYNLGRMPNAIRLLRCTNGSKWRRHSVTKPETGEPPFYAVTFRLLFEAKQQMQEKCKKCGGCASTPLAQTTSNHILDRGTLQCS